MSFKDLEVSEASNYLKLQAGENTVRIVSQAVPVWTAFVDGKPTKFLDKEAADLWNTNHLDKNHHARKKFAMLVINRQTQEVVCAEFGASIINAIKALAKDSNYGFDDLPSYDIKINKKGAGLETEYQVLPLPAKDLSEEDEQLVAGHPSIEDFLNDSGGFMNKEDVPSFDDKGEKIPF